jgi:AraC-like DNA-binding protein
MPAAAATGLVGRATRSVDPRHRVVRGIGVAGAPTISIHIVRAAFAEAIARGQDPVALAARFGVAPAELADPDGRVGAATMRRIWIELPDLIGEPDFGLVVARRAEAAGALQIVGYLARAAATVGAALQLALRYQRLVQDGATASWRESGDTVTVGFDDRDPRYRLPRHAVEFGVAAALALARGATGRDLAPHRLAFRHARPADDAEARRTFRCPIDYGAAANRVELRRADLARTHHTADPHLVALLERHARALETELPAGDTVTARVRRALDHRLAAGDTSLAAIARALGASPRTVQRRLRDEGTTHQRVLDELRHQLALRHLDARALTVQEIAFVLGFSDLSAFHHAFKRWTGTSPSAYRVSAASRAPAATARPRPRR